MHDNINAGHRLRAAKPRRRRKYCRNDSRRARASSETACQISYVHNRVVGVSAEKPSAYSETPVFDISRVIINVIELDSVIRQNFALKRAKVRRGIVADDLMPAL